MEEQSFFFSSADLGLNTQKIKLSVDPENGAMSFDWDKTDPELIAAGINDMTADQWGEVANAIEQAYLTVQSNKTTEDQS